MTEEISKIIIFGSFLAYDTPNDIDIAIVQNSNLSYLTLFTTVGSITPSTGNRFFDMTLNRNIP